MTFYPTKSSHPRGVALLIVLAVLMVTVAATAILVASAANVSVQRTLTQDERIAADLLTAVEDPIQRWLKHDSDKVLLPPDAAEPAVPVLRDAITFGAATSTAEADEAGSVHTVITITAFDQCGMVPLQLAKSASPLLHALPSEVQRLIAIVELPPTAENAALGLDDLQNDSSIAVFPAPRVRELIQFDSSVVSTPLANAPARISAEESLKQAGWGGEAGHIGETLVGVGGMLATHNWDPVRINVCTAPKALVEAACRLAGRGDVERIDVARRNGERPDVQQIVNRDNAPNLRVDGVTPQIDTTSDCWSFRIDIEVGLLKRSWWATYVPGRPVRPPGDSFDPSKPPVRAIRSDFEWTCIQRLAIDE